MPNDVRWPVPLIRQKPMFPGVIGGLGTDTRLGLRTDVSGVVVYVDPNQPGATADGDGTDPEFPLSTVAAALIRCRPYNNDTIAVMGNGSWQYAAGVNKILPVAEEVEITVPGVRLVGIMPASPLGVMWTPASNGGTCITVSAIDVTIEGFCFNEGAFTGCDAIYAEWDGVAIFADGLAVRNCVFADGIDVAIQLEFAWYCDIHHNWFLESVEHGIYVDPAGSAIAFCAIHDNLFQDCDVAMLLAGATECHVYENRIYNGNAQGAAAATDEGIVTTGGARNMVTDNWLSCLLPVPANGDYSDLNSSAATDAWVNNHCMDGDTVTNP